MRLKPGFVASECCKGQLVQRKAVFPPLHVPFPFLIRLEEVIVRPA